MEKIASPQLAMEWDNCGWQLGNPGEPVSNILVTMDVDLKVYQEAQEKNCQLIISHHPLFFKGMKQIDLQKPHGALVAALIRSNIAVYAAHTNLDCAVGGVNDMLARCIGLKDVEVLHPVESEKIVKLAVYVPLGYEDKVRQAVCHAGAGSLGQYSHCTFQLKGKGTFQPEKNAKPFIGNLGELSRVDEVKLEVVVPEKKIRQVVKAMLAVHPYEEVAYEWYPIQQDDPETGLGRIGLLPKAMTLQNLVAKIKEDLGIQHLRWGGNSQQQISQIALCGGSGSEFWSLAKQKGAEVMLTGDIGFHTAKDMLEHGLSFIDAGHYATEAVILPSLQKRLLQLLAEQNPEIGVHISTISGEPFSFC